MPRIYAEIKIKGIVQGVGFRPFIHRETKARSIFGTVKNTAYGAFMEAYGESEDIADLCNVIRNEAPRLAFIEDVEVTFPENKKEFSAFVIGQSEGGERDTLISPDVAICPDCLKELFDQKDRRFLYPFINCTNCGPRFTITRDIPYDRKNTTMAEFIMCDECAKEYADIDDRRYHAQPDCCDKCGPKLYYIDEGGNRHEDEPIKLARQSILDGKIVAIKGIGGVHLACRCDDAEAIIRLRRKKRRDEKPFAIMCRDIEVARRFADISDVEERILQSHRRPIVLLRKKECLKEISDNGFVGIMLPYTPVHYLLLTGELDCAVMTSANFSDQPIIYKDEEAVSLLGDVADGILLNDREIYIRCDDSLVWEYKGEEYFARRSRGYVPHPIVLQNELTEILACGAEQKASFALSRGRHIFASQHIGDLKNLETLECYEESIRHFENIFDISPRAIVCDLHPDYLSTDYAEQRAKEEGIPVMRVQHHRAHMASCMADNGYYGDCIGIIWDGTGLGDDGTVWGAEFLAGDLEKMERMGTILPITLPGGDRATKEINRIAEALKVDAGIKTQDGVVKKLIESGINCPKATSMGRLFDGVSALLGICDTASYEGQGAMLLEAAAENGNEEELDFEIKSENGLLIFDWRNMVREIVAKKERGVKKEALAAQFMNTLVSMAAKIAKEISDKTNIKTVALSGGTFQNMYILTRLEKKLEELGLRVLHHKRVSTNDEGIALGQLVIAERMLSKK